MKKELITVGALLVLLFTIINPSNTHATSWKYLSADEVIGSAEVIVQGEYDLSGFEGKMADSRMWIPFKFSVDRYFKGSGSNIIDTAIEVNDLSVVKEFQQNDGTFILFLKKDNQNGGLLIPVGGPNGMIKLLKGSIQKDMSSDDFSKYNEYISSKSTSSPSVEEEIKNTGVTFSWYKLVLVLAVIFLVLLFIRKVAVNRKSL